MTEKTELQLSDTRLASPPRDRRLGDRRITISVSFSGPERRQSSERRNHCRTRKYPAFYGHDESAGLNVHLQI